MLVNVSSPQLLVGGWALPLWKMMDNSSVGMMTFHSQLFLESHKNMYKHVPKHQPDRHFMVFHWYLIDISWFSHGYFCNPNYKMNSAGVNRLLSSLQVGISQPCLINRLTNLPFIPWMSHKYSMNPYSIPINYATMFIPCRNSYSIQTKNSMFRS